MSAPIAPEQLLQAWLSPAYPVSGFAYSHGLEEAIARGDVVDAASTFDWLSMVLMDGSGRNDALLIAASWRGEDVTALARARAVAFERRVEMDEMGAAFARTTTAAYGTELAAGPYPVVFGAACAAHGVPLARALPAYLTAFATTLLSAAVRLVPLGQTEAQALLVRAGSRIAALGREACDQTLEDLGSAAFASDMAAMEHARRQPRLFRT